MQQNCMRDDPDQGEKRVQRKKNACHGPDHGSSRMEHRPLTDLPAALLQAGYEPAPYREVYEAARSARIPAQRGRNGRWSFVLDDIPQIADRLRLLSSHAA